MMNFEVHRVGGDHTSLPGEAMALSDKALAAVNPVGQFLI